MLSSTPQESASTAASQAHHCMQAACQGSLRLCTLLHRVRLFISSCIHAFSFRQAIEPRIPTPSVLLCCQFRHLPEVHGVSCPIYKITKHMSCMATWLPIRSGSAVNVAQWPIYETQQCSICSYCACRMSPLQSNWHSLLWFISALLLPANCAAVL